MKHQKYIVEKEKGRENLVLNCLKEDQNLQA